MADVVHGGGSVEPNPNEVAARQWFDNMVSAPGKIWNGIKKGAGAVKTAVSNLFGKGQQTVKNTNDRYNVAQVLDKNTKNMMSAYATSAIKSDKENIERQYKYNKEMSERAYHQSETSAQKQRDWQEKMFEKQMDYETHMSNTAYRRQLADLRAAGINPLYVGKLNGASVPSVSVGSGASGSGYSASGSIGDPIRAKEVDQNSSLLFGIINLLLGNLKDSFTSVAKSLI